MTAPPAAPPPSPAATAAAPDAHPEAVARAVCAAYEDAWNRHDMAALAALFVDGAHWVNIVGMWWRGRDEIARAHAAYHATMFRTTGTRVLGVGAHVVAPGVVAAVATIAMDDFTTPDGRAMDGTIDRLSLVLVREGGGWRIAHGHNTVIDPVAAPHDPVRGERARAP